MSALTKKKKALTAEEKRLKAHKEMTKDEAYKAPPTAEEKRLKAHKEMTKDEAYSLPKKDVLPKVDKPAASAPEVKKPTVKWGKDKDKVVKGGNGNVTWSGGNLTPQEMKKRRESRSHGGRIKYSRGNLVNRSHGGRINRSRGGLVNRRFITG